MASPRQAHLHVGLPWFRSLLGASRRQANFCNGSLPALVSTSVGVLELSAPPLRICCWGVFANLGLLA